MIIVPVLVDVVGILKEDPQHAEENFGEFRWYKSLLKRLAEIGCSKDSENFGSKTAVEIAMKLIDNPLDTALTSLEDYLQEEGQA